MSLWIKICGNTTLADARLAAAAGAEALGFVFAPSPRRIAPGEAAQIIAALPASIEKIGVFVDAPVEEILATVAEAGLTGVQLHFNAPPALTAKLRATLGPEKKILRVLHFDPATECGGEEKLADPCMDAMLVDSRTKTAVGGTGQSFDWVAASQTLFRAARARGTRLIVAGGLTPGNVTEAIDALAPWGLDVVSGVEATPGKKDPVKLRAFLAAARAAR